MREECSADIMQKHRKRSRKLQSDTMKNYLEIIQKYKLKKTEGRLDDFRGTLQEIVNI